MKYILKNKNMIKDDFFNVDNLSKIFIEKILCPTGNYWYYIEGKMNFYPPKNFNTFKNLPELQFKSDLIKLGRFCQNFEYNYFKSNTKQELILNGKFFFKLIEKTLLSKLGISKLENLTEIEANDFAQANDFFNFFLLLKQWQKKLNIKLFNIDLVNLKIYYQNISISKFWGCNIYS